MLKISSHNIIISGTNNFTFDSAVLVFFFQKMVLVLDRPPDKSACWKIIFFIYHPKHMLWVLKRTVSRRRFFLAPKTHFLING